MSQRERDDSQRLSGPLLDSSPRIMVRRAVQSDWRQSYFISSAAVADVQHVSVLHNVVLALEPQLSFGAGVSFRPCFEQRVPVDCFGTNEVLFQIGVNGAGGRLRARAPGHGPGAALVFAD